METWLPTLIVSLTLLSAFGLVLLVQDRRHRETVRTLNRQFSLSTARRDRLESEERARLASLLDKTIGLVASADPLAYQAIQVMGPATPSEYDERTPDDIADQEFRAGKGDELSGAEQDFLQESFDAPGNEWWPVSSTDPAP